MYHMCPSKAIRWAIQSGPFIGIFYRYLHIVREPYLALFSIDEGNVPRDINVTKAFIQRSRQTYLACPSTCTGPWWPLEF